uniref:Putative polyprotein n=1 Tax=Albugo laibachii Nc14 TaxID=890382 RepID=F0WPH2_9STRA|nr:putative polyprotein [Albugo laibachii Nc14]|eukprot:CCA23220.1 putative polyprotein [Albugo laibachii Nc14]
MSSIRVYLSACCHQGFHIQQYDVDTALLNGHGHLEEEVYIYPPRGVQAQANEVCLLKRSLYGLKQAAATWFKTISQVFLEMGFRHCRTDSCIFVRQRGNSVVYIALYVDGMLIGAKTLEEMKAISDKLSRKFKLKDLGKVKFMLGIQVDYDREQRSMEICQTSSINKMVEKFNQVDAKLVWNPNVQGQLLSTIEKEDERMKFRPFRSLVGSLLYISNGTRPDIAFSVCQLSRHLERPSEEHWKAAVRVLRYLKSTSDIGINYTGSVKDLCVCAYSDADWANNKESRRSVSGIMVMINGAPVIFKSMIQQSVALSTAEAEYIALSLCMQEVLWLKSLLCELKAKIPQQIEVFEDNQSAIAIAKTDGY